MGKSQFNCRLETETIEAINSERQRLTEDEGRIVSQSEVIERLVPSLSFLRFREVLEPCVYGWRRGGEYLYIGSSQHGLRRVLDRGHHVIGKIEAVGEEDSLDIWVCENVEKAREFEQQMIANLQPLHNHHGIVTSEGSTPNALSKRPVHSYRISEEVDTLLKSESAYLSQKHGKKVSEADLIEMAIVAWCAESEQPVTEIKAKPAEGPTTNVPRRAESVAQRKAREAKEHAEKLAQSDVTARMAGREDIEYDLDNVPRQSALPVATLHLREKTRAHYDVQPRESKPLTRPHGSTEAKRRREQ